MEIIEVDSGFFIFDTSDQGVFIANHLVNSFLKAIQTQRQKTTIEYLTVNTQTSPHVSITDGTEVVRGLSDEILERMSV